MHLSAVDQVSHYTSVCCTYGIESALCEKRIQGVKECNCNLNVKNKSTVHNTCARSRTLEHPTMSFGFATVLLHHCINRGFIYKFSLGLTPKIINS